MSAPEDRAEPPSSRLASRPGSEAVHPMPALDTTERYAKTEYDRRMAVIVAVE